MKKNFADGMCGARRLSRAPLVGKGIAVAPRSVAAAVLWSAEPWRASAMRVEALTRRTRSVSAKSPIESATPATL